MKSTLLNLVLILNTINFTSSQTNGIVIVPGMAASQIYAKVDPNVQINPKCWSPDSTEIPVWFSSKYLLKHPISCVYDSLKLTYDHKTRTTKNILGIETTIPDFGDTRSIEVLDTDRIIFYQFDRIINRLKEEGYEPGVSIRGAPWDFRKGPTELQNYFDELKTLIEETYEINDQQSVIMMVHSMGALVTAAFLNGQTTEWKDKYIKFEISLAGAWGGTVKAIETYLLGLVLRFREFFPTPGILRDLQRKAYNVVQGMGMLPEIDFMIVPSITAVPSELVQSFPSILWLFPSPDIWDKSEALIQTDNESYTLENIEKLFRDLDNSDGNKMYEDVYPFVNNLQDPGVELYCFYGTGVPTIEKVILQGTISSKKQKLKTGDGDGFVNIRSLEACKRWTNNRKPIMLKSFDGISHAGILRSSYVLEEIINLIRSKT